MNEETWKVKKKTSPLNDIRIEGDRFPEDIQVSLGGNIKLHTA
jgi:hypothetical protein